MKIDYDQFIYALSDSLDLVGIDDFNHGKRVGYMATECARALGMSEDQQKLIYRAGLIHDCGVSSTRVHKKLVDELDWSESNQHCVTGANRLSQFPPLHRYVDIIRHHHSRWEDLTKTDLAPSTKTISNLIFLTDRIDALTAYYNRTSRLAARETICNKIAKLRNSYFSPELVDALLSVADQEAFWISQEDHYLQASLQFRPLTSTFEELDSDQLFAMGRLFAEIVDAKSPYTAEHSFGVAGLSRYLATRCQLDEETVNKIELAALLHDLGKLNVADDILESKNSLEGDSLAAMRHHSYITYRILGRIGGLEEISCWASDHHEKLDGSGYPFKKSADEIGIESRIVMLADIFQALAQNRPYRKALRPDEIRDIIKIQVTAKKLDSEIFRIIELELKQCHTAATLTDEKEARNK